MNKERLELLAKRLDETMPEHFDMHNWCGTACCIAGHALIMADKKLSEQAGWETAMGAASAYLALPGDVASDLMWPEDVQWSDLDFKPTPKQAARVVRHLIKTGKVEWERFVS